MKQKAKSIKLNGDQIEIDLGKAAATLSKNNILIGYLVHILFAYSFTADIVFLDARIETSEKIVTAILFGLLFFPVAYSYNKLKGRNTRVVIKWLFYLYIFSVIAYSNIGLVNHIYDNNGLTLFLTGVGGVSLPFSLFAPFVHLCVNLYIILGERVNQKVQNHIFRILPKLPATGLNKFIINTIVLMIVTASSLAVLIGVVIVIARLLSLFFSI